MNDCHGDAASGRESVPSEGWSEAHDKCRQLARLIGSHHPLRHCRVRHHQNFVQGSLKFPFRKVFMNCAEWWSLFEGAVAGAAQRMAATANKLRQCLPSATSSARVGVPQRTMPRIAIALRIAHLNPNIRIVQRRISAHGFGMSHDSLSFSHLDPAALVLSSPGFKSCCASKFV